MLFPMLRIHTAWQTLTPRPSSNVTLGSPPSPLKDSNNTLDIPVPLLLVIHSCCYLPIKYSLRISWGHCHFAVLGQKRNSYIYIQGGQIASPGNHKQKYARSQFAHKAGSKGSCSTPYGNVPCVPLIMNLWTPWGQGSCFNYRRFVEFDEWINEWMNIVRSPWDLEASRPPRRVGSNSRQLQATTPQRGQHVRSLRTSVRACLGLVRSSGPQGHAVNSLYSHVHMSLYYPPISGQLWHGSCPVYRGGNWGDSVPMTLR